MQLYEALSSSFTEGPSWAIFISLNFTWVSQDTDRDVTRMVRGRCGESASEVWGKSDLNPVPWTNSYTCSKPLKSKRDAMLQPGLSFVLASVFSSSEIYRNKWGWGSLRYHPWSHRALGVSKACSFSSNIGCCHAPTGVTFKFQHPFQVALFRQLRAYQKYKSSGKAPPPPRIPPAELFEKSNWCKKCRKKVNPIRSPQALHFVDPNSAKAYTHLAVC